MRSPNLGWVHHTYRVCKSASSESVAPLERSRDNGTVIDRGLRRWRFPRARSSNSRWWFVVRLIVESLILVGRGLSYRKVGRQIRVLDQRLRRDENGAESSSLLSVLGWMDL